MKPVTRRNVNVNVVTAIFDYIIRITHVKLRPGRTAVPRIADVVTLCRNAAGRRFVVRYFVVLLAFTFTHAAAAAPHLSATVIQDSGVYDASELFDVYREHLGRPVTGETASAIGKALRERYAADGYARPGYKILDSGEESGIVRIRLVELRISRVDWSGSAGPFDERVRKLADELPSASAARPEAIRDMLREARRLPGVSVAADTRADPQDQGGVVLDLDSTWQPLEGKLKLSNRGTREIGRNLAFAQVAANGLFGHENSLGLYAGTSEENERYRSGGVFANAALGSSDTSIRLIAGASGLRLAGDSRTEKHDRNLVKLRLRHLLRQNAGYDLSIWGAFALEDLDIAADGILLREDRLRSVEAGAALSWRIEAVQYYGSLEVEQGITGLDGGVSTRNNPDDPRRADFSIARLRFVRLAWFNESWSLRWDGYGQYSRHFLPSTKRFKVGGNRIGRGFEAAAISGDRGIGNTVKLNRRFEAFDDWRQHSGIYAFYDIGTVWREESGNRESAASAGVGLSFRAGWLSGNVELAKPLTHADEDGNRDAKVFAEIEMGF